MSKSRKIKFSRSKISIALVALAGIVVSLFALGVVSVPTVTTGATPTPTVFGGVLRNQAGEGWHLLNDATHHPYGLGSVVCSPNTGEISVYFSPAASGVIYSSVDTDESYARAGYAAGSRVSGARLQISFVRNLGNGPQFIPCTSKSLWINRSNVWIGGVVER
ncbi:MAG: hypothetical protein AAB922_07695 [Patescibacteria group bacterium]